MYYKLYAVINGENGFIGRWDTYESAREFARRNLCYTSWEIRAFGADVVEQLEEVEEPYMSLCY